MMLQSHQHAPRFLRLNSTVSRRLGKAYGETTQGNRVVSRNRIGAGVALPVPVASVAQFSRRSVVLVAHGMMLTMSVPPLSVICVAFVV